MHLKKTKVIQILLQGALLEALKAEVPVSFTKLE